MPSYKNRPWTGYYYVNLAEEGRKSWDDCKRYGIFCAGGGKTYRNQIQKLKPGDKILVYIPRHGFVGYGIVEEEACMARDFTLENGEKLLDQNLTQKELAHDLDDEEKCEWIVKVKWIKTLDKENAVQIKGKGHFHNQRIVCKLYNFDTYNYLKPFLNLD